MILPDCNKKWSMANFGLMLPFKSERHSRAREIILTLLVVGRFRLACFRPLIICFSISFGLLANISSLPVTQSGGDLRKLMKFLRANWLSGAGVVFGRLTT